MSLKHACVRQIDCCIHHVVLIVCVQVGQDGEEEDDMVMFGGPSQPTTSYRRRQLDLPLHCKS